MIFEDSNVTHWFAGDFHGFHKNICRGVSKWFDTASCRDFKDEFEMTNHIINETNKVVMPDDILWFGGDWSFSGIHNIWNLRKRLNVKTIYFCLGNHDEHIRKNKILPNVVKETNGDVFFDSNTINHDHLEPVRAQEIFTDVQLRYDIKIHGQRITLSHYSMNTWFYHNKGSWMLFGHSHGSLHPQGKTIDVGIDNYNRMFGEYRPFKFQELQKIMSKKDIYYPDHHNQKTNAK